MQLPANHHMRFELNDEVHARPPEALTAPCRMTYLALLPTATSRAAELDHVAELCRRHGVKPPPDGANHFAQDLGPLRFKWERHTEFTRYLFIEHGSQSAPFSAPMVAKAEEQWIKALPGETLVATQVELVKSADLSFDPDVISAQYFYGNSVIGSVISEGAAIPLTDFRIGPDGFSRVLVLDHSLARRQAGRVVQRILEIDTYRMMALLALPVARSLGAFLTQHERELAEITASMPAGLAESGIEQEQALLLRLTKLEGAIERQFVSHFYRFNASAAYADLVQRRIAELREARLPSLQTFQEFMERRLAPAMSTCRATAGRIEALSERVNRSSQLLSTQVAIERERQNQKLLEALARRAQLQLRLQQTVEGLSIAAITYYIVGLVGYLAKGTKSVLHNVEPDFLMALSIPLVAIGVAYGLHNVRKTLEKDD